MYRGECSVLLSHRERLGVLLVSGWGPGGSAGFGSGLSERGARSSNLHPHLTEQEPGRPTDPGTLSLI